ncbi:MAG: hypothetical protein FWE27_10120, partial [Defluviitaleaceae bacterium]|nr:hypothetical protein [Defluviitaleaceae bacterium]
MKRGIMQCISLLLAVTLGLSGITLSAYQGEEEFFLEGLGTTELELTSEVVDLNQVLQLSSFTENKFASMPMVSAGNS